MIIVWVEMVWLVSAIIVASLSFEEWDVPYRSLQFIAHAAMAHAQEFQQRLIVAMFDAFTLGLQIKHMVDHNGDAQSGVEFMFVFGLMLITIYRASCLYFNNSRDARGDSVQFTRRSQITDW